MQTGLIVFEIICKLNNINVDLRAIIRENGITDADITIEELLLIARKSDFKLSLIHI